MLRPPVTPSQFLLIQRRMPYATRRHGLPIGFTAAKACAWYPNVCHQRNPYGHACPNPEGEFVEGVSDLPGGAFRPSHWLRDSFHRASTCDTFARTAIGAQEQFAWSVT